MDSFDVLIFVMRLSTTPMVTRSGDIYNQQEEKKKRKKEEFCGGMNCKKQQREKVENKKLRTV